MLSYAASDAEMSAMESVRSVMTGKPDAWKKLPEDKRQNIISGHFNENLEKLLTTKVEPGLTTDIEHIRGVDGIDAAIIAADARTNAYRSIIRSEAGSEVVTEICPSRMSVGNYISKNFEKKDYESRPTEEVEKYTNTFEQTRAMIEICVSSSFEDIRKIVSDSHCPTGWKDDQAGLVPMYGWMKEKSLFTSETAAWDTTQNRETSAMRLEPRHFKTFGQPPLLRDKALREKAEAVKAEGGSLSRRSKESQSQVSFDVPEKTTSTKSRWLPSWLSGSKSSAENKPATDASVSTSASVPAPPSSNATTTTAAGSTPSGVPPNPGSTQTQNSNLQSPTAASTAPSSGFQSPWAGGSAAPPAHTNQPHFGFGPSTQALSNVANTSTQNTTRGAPFGGTFTPGSSSAGTGTTKKKKSSLSSGNAGRKKNVVFAGVAPGKTDGGGSTKKTGFLGRMFGNKSKVDGPMISSSASCAPNGTSFTPLSSTAMT